LSMRRMSVSMAAVRRTEFKLDPEVARAIKWRSRWGQRQLKRYAGKWVALRGRKVLATADTYDELDDLLESMSRPWVHVCRIEAPGLVVY